MKEYLRLHNLIFNQPHLCTPEYAETVMAVIGDKFGVDQSAFTPTENAKDNEDPNIVGSIYKLPILGSMVHRGSSLDAMSGISSYEGIKANIQSALDNPKIKTILLEMDSPGGSVAGAFDLRDFIMEAKEQKPIYAYARDTMASAAYLIGSACTKVYSSQTGNIGSIGVVAMHLDQSGRNKAMGVKPTFIYAGKMKTAGNPHEKLEGEALDYLQESVNQSYDMFVNAVAEARGLDEQTIRDTEARVYRGEKAVELGLADGVKSLDAVMEELAGNSQSGVLVKQNSKGMRMENEVEDLQAAIESVTDDLNDLKGKHESLQAAVIAEGYTITAEGISKPQEPEMIEVAGVMTDKASLPEHVVSALEANAKDKAEAEMKARAAAELPNFSEEAAMTILSAIDAVDGNTEEVMSQLKAADQAFANMSEELGEKANDVDMTDPREAMNALVNGYMEEHGVDIHKARVEVSQTAKGRELQKAMMKG